MRTILSRSSRQTSRGTQKIRGRRGRAFDRNAPGRGKSVRRALALAPLTLFALASCSSTTPGQAVPAESTGQPTSRSTPADEVPGPGVPKVPNPIDITRFKQNPCAALTAEQTSGLLGDGARIVPDPKGAGGPGCGWFSQAQIVVLFPNVDKLGLTSVYRAKGNAYPFFVPLAPVDGYPVVAYGTEDVRARLGECNVALGTSDRETIDVSITQSPAHKGEKDPCESAREVAEKVLGNLRGGR
ncbi:DUF3558 domain-containing protein [Amycolatopsis sp. La24]|uniref:DUF3558 domain-containing protein n=1 Tax=Amycolatopsis sp. La24 TaxID=3028304 RepID=UPI0023B112B4|nr:DUF3558 domain-containing protein [Amycolatopsis sp. La24]